MVVAPSHAGASPSARYVQAPQPSEALPAGTELAGILCTGELASPATVRVTGASRHDAVFQLSVEIRNYTGPLAGNVPFVALAEMEFGSLPAGQYAFTADIATLEFDLVDHPESARNPSRQEHSVSFQVR